MLNERNIHEKVKNADTYCLEDIFLSICSLETRPRKLPRKTSYPAIVLKINYLLS